MHPLWPIPKHPAHASRLGQYRELHQQPSWEAFQIGVHKTFSLASFAALSSFSLHPYHRGRTQTIYPKEQQDSHNYNWNSGGADSEKNCPLLFRIDWIWFFHIRNAPKSGWHQHASDDITHEWDVTGWSSGGSHQRGKSNAQWDASISLTKGRHWCSCGADNVRICTAVSSGSTCEKNRNDGCENAE